LNSVNLVVCHPEYFGFAQYRLHDVSDWLTLVPVTLRGEGSQQRTEPLHGRPTQTVFFIDRGDMTPQGRKIIQFGLKFMLGAFCTIRR
jgi:hypothetical protein